MSRTFTKNASNYGVYGSSGSVGALINGASKISVAIWAKPTSYSTSSVINNVLSIISIDGTNGSMLLCIDKATDANPRLRVSARSQSADSLQARRGAIDVPTGTWVLLGADIDFANDTITPRVNGVADNSGAVTFGATTYTQGAPSVLDRMGADSGSPPTTAFQWDGLLSHHTIWKFAAGQGLSDAEWLSLAAGTNPQDIQNSKIVLHTQLAGTASPEPSAIGGVNFTLTGTLTQGEDAPVNPVSPTDTIAVTAPTNLSVFQRSSGAATITISGTYTGTPTSIQARVVLDGTNTEVVTWTTITASPSGGTYTGTLSVPEGGWYNVAVRFSNDTAVTAVSSNQWGVGALFAIIGQSNGQQLFTIGSGTPSAGTSKYASSWAANAGAGGVALANSLRTGLGVPVGLIDTGVSGASLTLAGDRGFGYWLNSGGTPYTTWQTRVTAVGGKLEGLIWIGGESDALNGVSASAYASGFGSLMSTMRTYLSQATLPVYLAMLGRSTHAESTDAKWNAINDATLSLNSSTEVVACDAWELPMADTLHYNATGYTTLGQRIALAIRAHAGDPVSSFGPSLTSVTRVSSTVLDLNLTHAGGTDITPSSGITGLRFTDGGTPITPSSVVRQTASKIRATFSAPIAGTATAYAAWGQSPDPSAAPYDTSSLPVRRMVSTGIDELPAAPSAGLRRSLLGIG